MCSVLHDIPLIHDDILLLVFDDDVLVNDLHRVELTVFLESAEKHL